MRVRFVSLIFFLFFNFAFQIKHLEAQSRTYSPSNYPPAPQTITPGPAQTATALQYRSPTSNPTEAQTKQSTPVRLPSVEPTATATQTPTATPTARCTVNNPNLLDKFFGNPTLLAGLDFDGGRAQASCKVDSDGLSATARCCRAADMSECINVRCDLAPDGQTKLICTEILAGDLAAIFQYDPLAGFNACITTGPGAVQVDAACDELGYSCNLRIGDIVDSQICGDYRGNCISTTTCTINSTSCSLTVIKDSVTTTVACEVTSPNGNLLIVCDGGLDPLLTFDVHLPTGCPIDLTAGGTVGNGACDINANLNYKNACTTFGFYFQSSKNSCELGGGIAIGF